MAVLAAIAIACAPAPTRTPAPGPTSPPASSLPTASAEPTAGPVATPGPWLTMQWQQVEVSSAAGPMSLAGYGIASVAGGPRGGITLVVGEDEGALASALVRQGEDWTLMPLVGWLTDDSWPTLASRPSGYLAFRSVPSDEHGTFKVLTATSPDGITWRQAGELAKMESVREVAAREDRIVACGAPRSDPSGVACEVSSNDGATWRQSALPSDIREVTGVIAFGDGFLATATDTAGKHRTLLSADGLAWTMSDPDPAVPTGGWVTSLLEHDGVAILAGRVPSDRHEGAGGAALFTSRDGRTWQRAALPATEAVGFDLIDLGTSVLGVGSMSTGFQRRDVALLTSSDGVRWRLEPEIPWALDAGTEYEYATASGMALVLASVGCDCATQEIRSYAGTAVMTASPGVAPEPLPTPVPDASGAPAPPAFTAVGQVPGSIRSATLGVDEFLGLGDDGPQPVWVSKDGRTWTGGLGIPLRERESVHVVAGWSGGYVAAGLACAGECQDAVFVTQFWHRTASGDWAQSPMRSDHLLRGYDMEGPDPGVRAIVETDSGLIAVAVDASGGVVFRSTDGTAWRRVADLEYPPSAAVPWRGGVIVAGGDPYAANRWGAGATWYSPDGITWSEATMLESAPINALAVSGDHVVAVAKGPAALVSTDGRTWTWAPDQSTLAWGTMQAVLGGRDGFLALGYDRCSAGAACLTAWRSTDGLAWSRSQVPWSGPDDVTGPVVRYLLVGGRGEALALVPWMDPYPAGETETAIFGLPWAP